MSKTGYAENAAAYSVGLPDGVRLQVTEYGDPSARLTVVFLHGWTLDARLWGRQVADLPHRYGRSTRFVTFDLRGHGQSTASPRHATTLVTLADDLAVVLSERVPSGKIVLVGHSIGGMAIMEYAHRYADDFAARVCGVVLVATTAEGTIHTTYGLGPSQARLVRMVEMRGAALLARAGSWRPHQRVMPALGAGLRWLVFGTTADPDAVRLVADMIGRARLTAIGGFRPWVDAHHRVEVLAAMRSIPTAVLVGTHDRLTPPPCTETIVAALPDSEKVVCLNAGHMLPLERPNEVTDAIVRVCRKAAAWGSSRRGVTRIGTAATDLIAQAPRLRSRPKSKGA